MIPAGSIDAFRDTLFRGGYSLLLGSGVSMTSKNRWSQPHRSASKLAVDLCALTGVRPDMSLQRVYKLLNEAQVNELADSYTCADPSENLLKTLPKYLWKRIFSFNIDDVIEVVYERVHFSKQNLVPLNFDSDFQPAPEDSTQLQLIHLHGSVRQRDSGFVFSNTEYARVMAQMNPWMMMLSQLIATDPFVIAGTSLNEIDLEYYLSYRTASTPRRGRGPSLLVEPYPDAATLDDCDRYGLTLVQATFDDFMSWVAAAFPDAPSLSSLIVPTQGGVFPPTLEKARALRFFVDFAIASAADLPPTTDLSRFFYGAEPTWDDIGRHLDIERRSNQVVMAEVLAAHAARTSPVLVVLDDAATGKSTLIRRVAHDIAQQGNLVFTVKTFSKIDVQNANECFRVLDRPCIVCVDDLAEHVDQVKDLRRATGTGHKITVLGCERRYRKDYIDIGLAEHDVRYLNIERFTRRELTQVVEQYRRLGLLGATTGLRTPEQFARALEGDAIAVSVCRILNDFRPLDRIAESLWAASDDTVRLAYLVVALARYCYWGGLRYHLLQAAVGQGTPINALTSTDVPLRLIAHADNDEFIIPQSAVLSERLLRYLGRTNAPMMLRAFTALAECLAPYVNRRAIWARSPEARVTARLFDSDSVVRPLLGRLAAEFYENVKPRWDWNSRYWEQRALDTAADDLVTAIQFARHALAIEEHAYTLTTLSKLLLRSLGQVSVATTTTFAEAFAYLLRAIQHEAANARISVHPFMTLIGGTNNFLKRGGRLSEQQRQSLITHLNEARYKFRNDTRMTAAVAELDLLLAS